MSDYNRSLIHEYWWALIHWVERMNIHQWAGVLLVAALIGVLCMRGFGSRAHY